VFSAIESKGKELQRFLISAALGISRGMAKRLQKLWLQVSRMKID
jgi:hypothetical protein